MEIEQFKAYFAGPGEWVEAHTSGSTGAPKPIRLSKADMRRSARASNAFFGIGTDSHLASALAADYIAGKMMCVRAFEAGCRLTQLEVSSQVAIPDSLAPIDLLSVVPAQLPSLISRPDISRHVRQVLVGGAPAPQKLLDELSATGVKVWVSYGMTETCSHVALARGDDPSRTFRAMPGISFSTDSDNRLIIHAPAYTFGELATNDIVDLDSPSAFRWLGRADNAINSGGIKLFPEQLEKEYGAVLPPEAVYYVASRPSERWGSETVLVVEGSAYYADRLMSILQTSGIDRRHLPKAVEAVARLPRTSTGKIIRKKNKT